MKFTLQNNLKELIRSNKWLVGILFLCFVSSIGYALYFQIKPLVDARAYDVIAQNIVNGNGYRENSEIDIKNDTALLRVGPIYEYFLAGIYKVFEHNYESVWIMQALLRVLSTLLLYLSVLLIFKENEHKKRIALWAAGIFAFYPDLIEISAMLMTETLYLFFVCFLVYTFFKYVDNPKKFLLVILGVVSGLTVLARPPILFVLPIVIFYFFKKKQWKEIVIYIFIIVAVFVPWSVHNYKIYGSPMPFGVAGSVNFWIGNHIGANGEQETNKEINDFLSMHTVTEMESKSILEFKNYLVNHTDDFIKISVERANKYFSILRPMGFWFYSSGWKQMLFVFSSATFSFFVLVFGLGGIIHTLKFKEKSLYYLLAFTIATPLILFITVVETRYRFQIYPFLAIFASYFIESFKQNRKVWFNVLIVSTVAILANGLIDGLINFDQFKDKLLKL